MKNIVEAWKIRFKSSHHIAALILISLAAAAASSFYLTGDNNNSHILQQLPTRQQELTTPYTENIKDAAAAGSSCNLFAGKWVYDDVSYPLYKEEQCSFMRFEFARERYACHINGRKDFGYQKWRWQPHDCDLPRFNGTALLEKIRGKRVVFVGDSLNRNQWMSMLCLIDSSLDQSFDKSLTFKANLAIFKSIEYNAIIEMYWSPLLVESNCDNQFNHSIRDRIIKIRAIEKHARQWNDAHILIFDTFMWWLEPTMTLLWGSFESPDAIYRRVEMKLRRYEMALNTWSDWVEMNINRTKTKLFFMSQSPFHSRGESWDMIQSCYNESEPIMKEGYRGITTDVEMMRIAESVIKKLETRGVKVEYLNITQLSDYRRDSHPSIYRTFNSPLSEEQLANPKSYADCMHWCLPGLPDTWNQILYSYIINS